MSLFSAAFGYDIDNRAGVAPVLRSSVAGDDAEFLDRVQWNATGVDVQTGQ